MDTSLRLIVRLASRLPLHGALLAPLLALPLAAHAELWAYVDPQGQAHFAREKVDERYQLFYRGATSLDPQPAPPLDADVQALRSSTLFGRLAAHPNHARFDALIERHARSQNLDPALVKAVVAVESAFEPGAVSDKGAVGLMQVVPGTGERYGLAADARSVEQKLRDPSTNLRVGTRYLRDLMARFGNDLALALAAYNAGEDVVERYHNQIPPYPETQAYVKLVHAFYALYSPPPPAPPRPSRVTITPRRKLP